MAKLFSILFILFIVSCNSVNDEQDNNKKSDSETFENLKEIILKDYNDAITLLSFKYGIDSLKAREITMKYIEVYDRSTLYMISENKEDFDFNNFSDTEVNISYFINDMCEETKLDPKIVSSYLIDLKVFMFMADYESL